MNMRFTNLLLNDRMLIVDLLSVVVVDEVMALVFGEMSHSMLKQDIPSVFDNLTPMNTIVYHYNSLS